MFRHINYQNTAQSPFLIFKFYLELQPVFSSNADGESAWVAGKFFKLHRRRIPEVENVFRRLNAINPFNQFLAKRFVHKWIFLATALCI